MWSNGRITVKPSISTNTSKNIGITRRISNGVGCVTADSGASEVVDIMNPIKINYN
jgi:hypothetical protein